MRRDWDLIREILLELEDLESTHEDLAAELCHRIRQTLWRISFIY